MSAESQLLRILRRRACFAVEVAKDPKLMNFLARFYFVADEPVLRIVV